MREAPLWFAADHPSRPVTDVVSPETGNTWGWRLKVARFLPRWASRLTLEITEVRVERVQSISKDDAWAEGVTGDSELARETYRDLWDSLNKKRGYGWNVNPFVWVLSVSPRSQKHAKHKGGV